MLTLSGAILTPVFYFVVGSVPLTALALSTIIIGLVSAMLGNARPDISPEASQMMLQSGIQNIAALLEELGLRSRAVYMPSSASGGRPTALIPLKDDGPPPSPGQTVSGRLIARYGPNLEDMCLVVTTPGVVSLDGITTSLEGDPEEIESVLNNLIVGVMDLANSVSVQPSSRGFMVEIRRPKLGYQNIWFYRCLGSPLASIAATVTSEVLNRPVRVGGEEETKKGIRIEIEVLP